METLQLAQMLADLSSLNATEPPAASSLLNASKKIDTAIEKIEIEQKDQPKQEGRPGMKRAASAISSTGTGGKFDKFNRHLLGSQSPSRPSSAAATCPATPIGPLDIEDDVDKASMLMALHEIRAKLRQQDNTSLMRAREKIDALAARQQAREAAELAKSKDESRKARYHYPR
ncbi:hypothetical protein SAPIO_CDS3434 [Scedosporium apiospermum]|uniref:Uncharacterized protein n=1 Tax=Pseudallescheria apiosperma TaxID=563466 RepID=A0A084GAS1_PSEDA|nr:uncharacterized protein SAPIO_CDS3434 [Scedosporium apiospermum]KEZ44433.1 hypothetical protein SAPIO_CDS3434 [Scedosporium apiospermum]